MPTEPIQGEQPPKSISIFIQPEVLEALQEEAKSLVEQFPIVVIETAEEYEAAVEAVKRYKQMESTAEERLRPGIKMARQMHQWMLDLLGGIVGPIIAKRKAIDQGATNWWVAQERARKAQEDEQRRIVEENQRKAEELRQRQIREAKAADQKKAEDDQLDEGARLHSLGLHEAAEELISLPVEVDETVASTLPPLPAQTPVVVQRTAPIVKGRHYVKQWKFEIINPAEVPREYCEPSEKKIRGEVAKMEGAAKIPGVRIFEDTGSSTRK